MATPRKPRVAAKCPCRARAGVARRRQRRTGAAPGQGPLGRGTLRQGLLGQGARQGGLAGARAMGQGRDSAAVEGASGAGEGGTALGVGAHRG
jgi:hypothetical protein